MPEAFLPLAFLGVAFFYSMGGFAGGSSYLLALTLAGVPYSQIPATALACNIFTASIALFHFAGAGHFRFKLVAPFVVLSVPAAWLGAQVHVPQKLFIVLSAGAAAIAALRIYFSRAEYAEPAPRRAALSWALGLPIGGAIGFLSGLTGIGGGIFVCPVLILLRFMTVKQASAAASFFILLNSLSGFHGRLQKGFSVHEDVVALAATACLGGFLGSRIGAQYLPSVRFRRVLASLLTVIAAQAVLKIL